MLWIQPDLGRSRLLSEFLDSDKSSALFDSKVPAQANRLLSRGAFASPVFSGALGTLGSQMASAMEAFLGVAVPWLTSDVDRLASIFRGLGPPSAVTAQICAIDPREPGVGYSRWVEELHVDTDPTDSSRELVRLTRVYIGPGTEWIADAHVDRAALKVAMKFATHRARAGYGPDARSRELLHKALAPGAELHSSPKDCALISRGGWKRGLLHRAPPESGPRVVLTITATPSERRLLDA